MCFFFLENKESQEQSKDFEKTWRTSIGERGTQRQAAHEFYKRSKRHFLMLSFVVVSPLTSPHPSKPLQRFTHVMPTSGIGLNPGWLCASASHVNPMLGFFINVSRQFTRFIKMDGRSPVVLYGHRDCWRDHSFWDLGRVNPFYIFQCLEWCGKRVYHQDCLK